MKIRFFVCLVASLVFGSAFVKFAIGLRPYLFPETLGYGASSPEGLIFLLPVVYTSGFLAAASLCGAWFYGRALRGRPLSRTGLGALGEGLALLFLSAGLAGSSVILLVLFFGHAIFSEGWWVIIPYSISTLVGLGAGIALFFAAKAFGRVRSRNPAELERTR